MDRVGPVVREGGPFEDAQVGASRGSGAGSEVVSVTVNAGDGVLTNGDVGGRAPRAAFFANGNQREVRSQNLHSFAYCNYR